MAIKTDVSRGFHSIGSKLLLPICICFVFFALMLLSTITVLTRSTAAASFKAGIDGKDGLVYRLIDQQTALLEKKAQWIAQEPGIIAVLTGGEQATSEAHLEAMLGALDVDGIAVVDSDDYLLIYSATSRSDGARYVRTIVSYTEDRQGITRLYSLDNSLELISAIPIFQEDRLLGYGFIEYSLQSDQFLSQLQALTQCDIDLYQGFNHRNSSEGLAEFSAQRKTWIGPFTGSISSDHDRMIDTVLGLGETYRGEYQVAGITYYGVHFPLKDGSDSRVGILSMSLPMSSVDATVALVNRVVLPLLLGGILLLLGVFLLLLRLIVIHPLKATAAATAQVSENLSSKEADFTYQIPIKRRDEIGIITGSINGFIASLRDQVIRLKDAQGSLTDIGAQLGTQAEESVKANARIMDRALDIKTQTEGQSQSLERTNQVLVNAASALQGLNAVIEDQNQAMKASSSSLGKMEESIHAVQSAVQGMKDQFHALVQVADTGKERQDAADQQIQRIRAQSEALMGANQLIAKMSARTTLLAMNATIEAAHAGAAGKGFTVVADEIRSLAGNARTQSQMIKEELSGIVQLVEDTSQSSAKSQEAFLLLAEEIKTTDRFIKKIDTAMEAQGGALAQIEQALEAINHAGSRVNDTSRDMIGHMDRVKQELDTLTGIVQAIQQGIIGMGDSAKEVNLAAETVLNLARDTHRNIHIMEETIGSFQV
ncbi:MAG: methyl-accepting chemotaxis protein [Treponema sp.]|jgi:methyl-accepting chemotaxis protein|nr:methyl-accepting chemotaxis protein [Treponema sp.]